MKTTMGHPTPFGATVTNHGINFAFYSQHATRAFLDLFDHPMDVTPAHTLELDPSINRTGDVWHIFVEDLKHGQLYGFRLDGPFSPTKGHRFNVHKLLADPYARAVTGCYDVDNPCLYGYDKTSSLKDRSFSASPSTCATTKCVAIEKSDLDWDTAKRPKFSLQNSVIYECHVKGMTAHPSSLVQKKGTFLGFCEKIPHLKELGVTSIELLPIAQFNPLEPPTLFEPNTGERLHNYWGYATTGFFAPYQGYIFEQDYLQATTEFQSMVKAFHEANMEVILDVVFNHSGEGNELGPTLGFRGLDNANYYMLDEKGRYKNYTGCGNTLNCNHPVMKTLIIECLRYWLVEMHVDGFRFDLATILGRSNKGEWISDPNLGLLRDIADDPILRGCKLIAESWDADGMYKVGHFPSAWAEWNGAFRDDIRKFVRGDRGCVKEFAKRIGGSYDLFGDKQDPSHSINFITAHDGFTLRDLCSYKEKHNHNNGEQNRDGSNENFSDNFGVEGESLYPETTFARIKRAKNMLTALFIARGTPMLLGGDELWRTQKGNNNTYCQDNPLGWVDWTPTEHSQDILRFTRNLIALRKCFPALRNNKFSDPFQNCLDNTLKWHGVQLNQPDWRDFSHTLAFELGTENQKDVRFYVAFNAWKEALEFELPKRTWFCIINTALPSPQDFTPYNNAIAAIAHKGLKTVVQPDSVQVFACAMP